MSEAMTAKLRDEMARMLPPLSEYGLKRDMANRWRRVSAALANWYAAPRCHSDKDTRDTRFYIAGALR